MELKVMDRVLLRQLLPIQGNIITLKIVKDALDTLDFTKEEIESLNFVQEGQNLKWDSTKDQPKEIVLSSLAIDMIKKELRTLEEQQKLKLEQMNIYDLLMNVRLSDKKGVK